MQAAEQAYNDAAGAELRAVGFDIATMDGTLDLDAGLLTIQRA
jgi:hypothetical protein